VQRVPLPLPTDGLRAVDVYVLETDAGPTLVDAGWAIEGARDLLESALAALDHATRDITRFLVTHVHRDHDTQAVTVRREFGAHISTGLGTSRPSTSSTTPRHDAATRTSTPCAPRGPSTSPSSGAPSPPAPPPT